LGCELRISRCRRDLSLRFCDRIKRL
jgi:hypothetical protein